MKTGKRILAALLSVVLLFSLHPLSVLADDSDAEDLVSAASNPDEMTPSDENSDDLAGGPADPDEEDMPAETIVTDVPEQANPSETEDPAENPDESFSEETELAPGQGIVIPDKKLSGTESEVIASGECGALGDNLTWTLDENGVLTITGEGEMANYDLTGPFSECSNAPWADLKA